MNEVDANYLFAGSDVQSHKPIQDGFAGGSIGQIHGWSFGVYVCLVWKEEGKWGETLGAQCLNVLRQYEAIRELEALHLTPRDSRQRTRKRRVCVVSTYINAASFYFVWKWLCSLRILGILLLSKKEVWLRAWFVFLEFLPDQKFRDDTVFENPLKSLILLCERIKYVVHQHCSKITKNVAYQFSCLKLNIVQKFNFLENLK